MIGRSLSLQETGAPSSEDVRRARIDGLPLIRSSGHSSIMLRQRLLLLLELVLDFSNRLRRPVRFWRELAAVALLLMGLSWTVPWFQSLTRATSALFAGRVYLVLLGLGLVAFLTARVLNSLPAKAGARRWGLAASLGLGLLVGLKSLLYVKEVVPLTALVMRPLWAFTNFSALIPNEFIVVIAVLLAWRRGAVLSLDYIGPERVRSEFKLGFWMFLLFSGVNTFVTTESIDFEFLGGYVLFGLIAMGAARMSAVGELRGGRKAVFDKQRLVAVMLGAGLSALLAYWIGFNFAKDGAVMAAFVVGGAVLAVFIVSIPFLLAALYLLYTGLSLFQDDISLAMAKLMDAIEDLMIVVEQIKIWLQVAGAFLAEKLIFLEPIFRWLFSLAPLVRNLVIAAAVLLAGALVFLVLYIRARRLRDPEAGGSEDTLGMKMLLAALRKRFMKNLSDRRTLLADAFDLRARYRRQLANRIRRIYADLLDLSETLGLPRKEAQTPREFEISLERLFPDQTEALTRITEAYQLVRYGELPEDRRETLEVEAAYQQVRKAAGRKYSKRTV